VTKLFLDFETASVADIKLVGLDNYAKHPSTRPLMLAWAFDDDEPALWFPHGGRIPPEVQEALESDVELVAWNTAFERFIFRYPLKIELPTSRWVDPMVWARHLSLPGHLADAGMAIGLPPDLAKIADGKRLIKKFSMPYHKGGEETLFGISEPQFHNWEDEPRDWELFGSYCKQDVVAERAILKLVSNIPLPESERRAWILDQKINDRGIPVNRKFVQNALALSLESKKRLTTKLKEITEVANPNSRDQFLKWAQTQQYPHMSLGKNFVKAALAQDSGITALCRRALELRKETAKISYMKFENLLSLLSEDDRLRHAFSFMGASRTGRWSGKGGGEKGKSFQPQNLPRPDKEIEKHYDRALELISLGIENYDATEAEIKTWFDPQPGFPSIIGMTTSCIRSAIQAPEGKKLVVCDLSAIENRVLGWLANCDAILQVFRDGRDPYIDFGTKMYHIAYAILIKAYKEKDKDAAEKRQTSKPAVLGAGYGLGPGAVRYCAVCKKEVRYKKDPHARHCSQHPNAVFVYEAKTEDDGQGNIVLTGLMGYAKNMGVKLTAEQSYLAWETFRDSYPEVVELWDQYQKAAVKVLKTGQTVKVGKCIFQRRARKDGTFILRIILPSGRGLHYINARVETEIARRQSDGEEYERDKIMYDGIGHGVGQIGKGNKWGSVYTYGGKITENGDQGFSRDVFTHGMILADEMGMNLVFHAHDEAVAEEDDDPFAPGLSDLKFCMEFVPEYAPGLLLAAEGWEGKVYKKG
jgi:DNA polymerase